MCGRCYCASFLRFVVGRGATGVGEYFVISLRDQVIVAASDERRNLAAAPERGLNPLYDSVRDGHEGSGVSHSSGGVAKLYSSKRVPAAAAEAVLRQSLGEQLPP